MMRQTDLRFPCLLSGNLLNERKILKYATDLIYIFVPVFSDYEDVTHFFSNVSVDSLMRGKGMKVQNFVRNLSTESMKYRKKNIDKKILNGEAESIRF
jgi:hypothetical protein